MRITSFSFADKCSLQAISLKTLISLMLWDRKLEWGITLLEQKSMKCLFATVSTEDTFLAAETDYHNGTVV